MFHAMLPRATPAEGELTLALCRCYIQVVLHLSNSRHLRCHRFGGLGILQVGYPAKQPDDAVHTLNLDILPGSHAAGTSAYSRSVVRSGVVVPAAPRWAGLLQIKPEKTSDASTSWADESCRGCP